MNAADITTYLDMINIRSIVVECIVDRLFKELYILTGMEARQLCRRVVLFYPT